jgi:hypothetical protein
MFTLGRNTQRSAVRPDAAIGKAILVAVQPLAVEAAFVAAREASTIVDELRRALELEREQADYEAKLARRRYEKVDSDNRLVAAELEARWNTALARLSECEERLVANAASSELRVRKPATGEHTRRASDEAECVFRDMADKWSHEEIVEPNGLHDGPKQYVDGSPHRRLSPEEADPRLRIGDQAWALPHHARSGAEARRVLLSDPQAHPERLLPAQFRSSERRRRALHQMLGVVLARLIPTNCA